MHTGPMRESEGDFSGTWKADCKYCGGLQCVTAQEWNSHCGGFTDYTTAQRLLGNVSVRVHHVRQGVVGGGAGLVTVDVFPEHGSKGGG